MIYSLGEFVGYEMPHAEIQHLKVRDSSKVNGKKPHKVQT